MTAVPLTPAPPGASAPASPARPARPAGLLVVLVAAAVAVLVAGAARATALTPQEAREAELVAAVNAERARAHLAPVGVSPRLTELARQQSAAMAARGRLAHSRDLGRKIRDRRVWSENVGYAGSPAHVHRLLMTSRPHRQNILAAGSRRIGIGVTTDGAGRVWVTQILVQPR